MAKKNQLLCYFCGTRADSNEHAPPKQMFKAFSCDSITVPSCQKHNNNKSSIDQAIVSAFLIPLSNGIDRYPIEEVVMRAIEAARSAFPHTKNLAIDSPLFKNPPEVLKKLPNLAYLNPKVNIFQWVKQLTAALVWDALEYFEPRIDWSKAIAWSKEWIQTSGPASIEVNEFLRVSDERREIENNLIKLPWINGWTAKPRGYPKEIYFFKIACMPDSIVGFRHTFYSRYSWYVFFQTSDEVSLKIDNKSKQNN